MIYKNLSGGQFERLMATFSRSSSHAVDMSRAIAAGLRLDRLSEEVKERREDRDAARVVDLGSGPGVALGMVLKAGGLVREVFTGAAAGEKLAGSSSAHGAADTGDAAGAGAPKLAKAPPRPPPSPLDAAADQAAPPPLALWCVDPFYGKDARESAAAAAGGRGSEHAATLPTDAKGCRLQAAGGGRVHFVTADGLQFMRGCHERVGLVDRVLMKEMIHHVDDYAELSRCLGESLRPGTGIALIAGRTPSEDIPWFPQAATLFAESCMDTERICGEIRRVPGLRVATSEHVFHVQISLAEWCTLLRGRFWSHLDTVSDEEMERGISEVREAHGGKDAAPVTFPDRLVFIQVFRGYDDPPTVETTLG